MVKGLNSHQYPQVFPVKCLTTNIKIKNPILKNVLNFYYHLPREPIATHFLKQIPRVEDSYQRESAGMKISLVIQTSFKS